HHWAILSLVHALPGPAALPPLLAAPDLEIARSARSHSAVHVVVPARQKFAAARCQQRNDFDNIFSVADMTKRNEIVPLVPFDRELRSQRIGVYRRDRTWGHDVYTNALRAQLYGKCTTVIVQCSFGRTVVNSRRERCR